MPCCVMHVCSFFAFFALFRHFNRKYPIQLIVKQNFDSENLESTDFNKSTLAYRSKKPKIKISDLKDAPVEKFTEIEVKGDGGEIDFAETILNADVSSFFSFFNIMCNIICRSCRKNT